MSNLTGVNVTFKNKDPHFTIDLKVNWKQGVDSDLLHNEIQHSINDLLEAVADRSYRGRMS